MSDLEKQIKAYIKEISGNLPWNYPDKKKLMHTVEQNVRDFLEEHPMAEWSEIIEQFGSASDVGESYLRELSDEKIAQLFWKK